MQFSFTRVYTHILTSYISYKEYYSEPAFFHSALAAITDFLKTLRFSFQKGFI